VDRPQDAVPYIERTRELYARHEPYRWVVHDPEREPTPWTPIEKPLSAMRVALISSGGVYRENQEPFHFRNDTSHREIPLDADPAELQVAHFGYDIRDAQRDPGCVLPLRALCELARDGAITEASSPALSFMGGIYSARAVREELALRLRDLVLRQNADLAYLVPA
jgi:D-proline reductase (dithiol) PrdB